MILLADESVDMQIVGFLRSEGHEVVSITEINPGLSDQAVFSLANQRGAILLTADKDFGEIVFRQGQVGFGVILLRLLGISPDKKGRIVGSAVRQHSEKFLRAFGVITPHAVRIRSRFPGGVE